MSKARIYPLFGHTLTSLYPIFIYSLTIPPKGRSTQNSLSFLHFSSLSSGLREDSHPGHAVARDLDGEGDDDEQHDADRGGPGGHGDARVQRAQAERCLLYTSPSPRDRG